ncbi:SMI1/KNR4 family protein [Streptomyces sp. NBC_00365]|nr:SMI1/KNR4 family protein [Streptomyces sp. NBC_00365]MCX5097256.1 SMI1/KNR4 family protein [Streptomyces sp. NBC_00365]
MRDAWLGFAPASEVEVAAAEARLGRRLPPSLREFLLVTNG